MLESRKLLWVVLRVLLLSWFLSLILFWIWRQIEPTTLVYDQFLAITLIVFAMSYYMQHFQFLELRIHRTKLDKFLTSLLIALLFFSTVQYSVLTVDRSRSLYLLQWVEDGKVKLLKGEAVIAGERLPEMKVTSAVTQRVKENTFRGLVTGGLDGEQKLTRLGKLHLFFAQLFAELFNLKGWYENT